MNIALQEQLAQQRATKQAAMTNFLHAALHGQTEQVCQQAAAALDIGNGPSTAEVMHIVIAAARGVDVSKQALFLLGRIAFQHSEFNAGA